MLESGDQISPNQLVMMLKHIQCSGEQRFAAICAVKVRLRRIAARCCVDVLPVWRGVSCRRVAARCNRGLAPIVSPSFLEHDRQLVNLPRTQVLNIDVAACDEKFWRKLDEVKKPFGPIMSDVMNIKHVPEVRVLACEA